MSTSPPIAHRAPSTPTKPSRFPEKRSRDQLDLNRPLPAPPSSLPIDYEIPTLRREPPAETTPPSYGGHTRSFSHPFPVLFGSKRQEKKSQSHVDDFESSDNMTQTKENGSRSRKGSKQPKNSDNKSFATGKCMTCNTSVRWPQHVKVFRCTTCLTINDTEALELQSNHSDAAAGSRRKALYISLNKTRELADGCIQDFFHSILHQNSLVAPTSTDTRQTTVHESGVPRSPNAKLQNPSHGIALASTSSVTFDNQTLSKPSINLKSPPWQAVQTTTGAVTNSSKQMAKSNSTTQLLDDPYVAENHDSSDHQLFRSLESYIAICLTGSATLNNSFFSSKPGSGKEGNLTKKRYVQQKTSDHQVTTPLSEHENFLSELDAKTLLLGDVAENGSWWTGDSKNRHADLPDGSSERFLDRSRRLVSVRSPRIDWTGLAEWYRIIINAGNNWRERWAALRSTLTNEKTEKWHSISTEMLSRIITDSQVHLQRSLLKACENLLKRPGQPLSSPEDCRFLLMVLANPLLFPVVDNCEYRNTSREQMTSSSNITTSKSPLKLANSSNGHHGNLGRHSGIIKRVLGLLAHVSNETHLYLVAWFARFSDSHFTRLVDLVSSFVTYRLIRQSNKPIQKASVDPTQGLIPNFSEGGLRHASQMHAALDSRSHSTQKHKQEGKHQLSSYGEDWQIKAAARIMALLFQANTGHSARKRDNSISMEQRSRSAGLSAKHHAHVHGQIIPINNFYNSVLDHADLIADFEAWETTKSKFTFCQYPFFLSIWAKIHILEYDARRQMEAKAKEAFFDSILTRKAVSQYLVLKVRRDCLVDDSLKSVSEAIGRGDDDVKKGLRIDFVGEDGVDAGGLRKEWFLLLVREIFNPHHGLFVYDDESQYCYFNPFCFESSEQFFLVGILFGLAIYNSTILDVAFPPFVFKKMLASGPSVLDKLTSTPKISHQSSLDDLAELKPTLARGLRQLLEFEGDVQETYCWDFVVDTERYGSVIQVPLCPGGASRPVTNANRHEFVDLYVHHLLDQSVARQYEPFKRGFFTVCGGNALSLFRPEEIEMLIRGSDEPLDVTSLRAVASYDGWPKDVPAQQQPQVVWFWEFFQRITPDEQRKMLSFITGSDRIPAMGATNLNIRLQLLLDTSIEGTGQESQRLPISRTCFNLLGLYRYRERRTLEEKLWTAVTSAEGFGLK